MNRLALSALALVLVTTAGQAATPAPTPPPPPAAGPGAPAAVAQPPMTPAEQREALHALGVLISNGIVEFSLSEDEFKVVLEGLSDGYHHKSDPTQAMAFQRKLEGLQRERRQATAEHQHEIGEAYIAKAAAEAGATKTESGIVYIPVKEGTGASPTVADQVKVNYTGRLVDGTVFDSSSARGAPATFALRNVIPCFTQGLQMMKVGGESRIVCPANLAYGDRGSPPKIRPGATLEFTIELLEIIPAPTPPAPPAPPSAPNTPPKN
jgi:FKBP-type peptidyl-prolyl cis-trans isomerase FkpA/FKBP-type peptidyl-prolyl cis-trans isomerase FklB